MNVSGPTSSKPIALLRPDSRVTAENDEKIVEAAKANTFANFSAYLDRVMDELFIDRMEGNEEIFSRIMTDKECPAPLRTIIWRERYLNG